MPAFDKSHFPRAFKSALEDELINPKLHDGEKLKLSSRDVGYAAAKRVLSDSSAENYPYYVVTILNHMLDSKTISPGLNELFQMIDFGKLAGEALEAQPSLNEKIEVFLVVMGLFYDRDLLKHPEADALVKGAAEGLHDSLVDILERPADEDVLSGLMITLPGVIMRYYQETVPSEAEAAEVAVNAGRLHHFTELLKGTLLYPAMLISMLQADYEIFERYTETSVEQPEQLNGLTGHDYKSALLTVADLPACSTYFGDKITVQKHYGIKLLSYLERVVFKNDILGLYDFLKKTVPANFFDRLPETDQLTDIRKGAIVARLTDIRKSAIAAQEDEKAQRLMKNAVKEAMSPFMLSLEKVEAMLGIMANNLARLEQRMASLEKRLGPQAESPRARGFFSPTPEAVSAVADSTNVHSHHKDGDGSLDRDPPKFT